MSAKRSGFLPSCDKRSSMYLVMISSGAAPQLAAKYDGDHRWLGRGQLVGLRSRSTCVRRAAAMLPTPAAESSGEVEWQVYDAWTSPSRPDPDEREIGEADVEFAGCESLAS